MSATTRSISLLASAVVLAQAPCPPPTLDAVFDVAPHTEMAGPLLDAGSYYICIAASGRADSFPAWPWRRFGPFPLQGGVRYRILHTGDLSQRAASSPVTPGQSGILLDNRASTRNAFALLPATQPAPLRIDGPWSVIDDTGNCKGTIHFQQSPSGSVTAITGSHTCENGRVTGKSTASAIRWTSPNTLQYTYTFSPGSSPRLYNGTATAVFASPASARLNARDVQGNLGSNQLVRDQPPPPPPSSHPSIAGTWTVIDDSGNCKGTITIRQSPDATVDAITGSQSCENGRVTGSTAASAIRWSSPSTLHYNYHFTSRSSPNLNDGSATIVFQSENAARLSARDNKGNTGSNQLQRR